jgi:predicted metalloprotease
MTGTTMQSGETTARRITGSQRLLRRALMACAVGAVAVSAAACGGDDTATAPEQARQDTTTTTAPATGGHAILYQAAGGTAPVNGTAAETTMPDFMTAVFDSVHGYWAEVFAANGLAEPTISYVWIAPGDSVATACDGGATDDASAFYCPADDTMYVSQKFAQDLWSGADGGAGGDFAVATVIAHEYGHNVQAELGIDMAETQADCFAGAWTQAAELNGELDDGDVWEAMLAADNAGSYDPSDPHGTPEQRVAALLAGYGNGVEGCFA